MTLSYRLGANLARSKTLTSPLQSRFVAEQNDDRTWSVVDMAMMRLLAREGVGLAVLPPIVVKGELASGALVEFDALPGMIEPFYAVTINRHFPNAIVRLLFERALIEAI